MGGKGYPANLEDSKIVAFYPGGTRDKRYKDGLLYFIDEKYTPTWAKELVSTYIFPRLTDDNGNPLPPDKVKPLAILGYSLGARESIMVENAIVDLLETVFSLRDAQLISYMNRFCRLGIDHAVNWELASREFASNAISVVTINDIGIKRPQSFTNGAFGDGECFKQAVTIKHHAPSGDRKPHEFLVVLRDIPAFVENDGEKQPNRLGKGLEHYLTALHENIPECIHSIRNFISTDCLTPTDSISNKSQKFNPHQRLSGSERGQMLTSWATHLFHQDTLEWAKIPLPNIHHEPQKWQKHFAENPVIINDPDNRWSKLLNNLKDKEKSIER